MASLLGGAYLGVGILLTYTISGFLGDWPARHIIMGASFGVALSLVIICGAEMFTGNAFVLYNGLRRKLISVRDVLCLWAVCYGGNWLGAVILSLLFYGAGYDTGTTAEAITEAAAMKMSLPPSWNSFSGAFSAISSSAWQSGAVSAAIPMQVN